MKVGLVGCGSIAKIHAEVIRQMPQTELTAFADCKLERAEDFADQYGAEGARAYPSLEAMVEQEELEVLHICTPHYLHVPMAVYGLGKKLHVFLEKPPAISGEEFAELEHAEKTSKKRAGVCFQNRCLPASRKTGELLRREDVGKILGARAFVTWCREKEYYTDSGWRGAKKTEGGGALINQAIHTLDLLVQFMGSPIRAEAVMRNHHLKELIEVEDMVEAYLVFESSKACFYATTAYTADSNVFLEFECQHAVIRLEGTTVWCRYRDQRQETYEFPSTPVAGKAYWGDGHGSCIREFYQSLRQKTPFICDLASTKNTFLLMMDLYQSAKEGKEAKLWNK